jgi:flagellar protein FliL
MASDGQGNRNEGTRPGSGPGMLIWIAVIVLSAGGGAAAPYVFSMLENASAGGSRSPLALPDPNAETAFLHFGETVVNLDEGRLTRYLRISITLQVPKTQRDEIARLIDRRKVILKNWLISYLSDKDMDDIRGAAGQNRLRREIQDHFNSVLFTDGYDRIHDVLFEEFNVQ